MVGVGRQDIGSRSVSIEGEPSEKESALQKTVLINKERSPSKLCEFSPGSSLA